MKVALVHDWLVTYRGGERVLEQLCRMYPDAPIYTLFHQPGSQPLSIESHRIVESVLGRVPGARRRHRWFLPAFPWAIEQFDLSDFDLVVSTSHAVAKGVITRADATHVCYVHTPMRYVWEQRSQYTRDLSTPARIVFEAVAPFLRLWDEASEKRVDHFVANSRTVEKRIAKRYRREADVVNPPVDTDRFAPTGDGARDFYLVVSALVPYKRIDLVCEAFEQSKRRLVVVGDGPERARLQRRATPNVEFVGAKTAAELIALYQNAKALIFPGEEDFGITPVEAMAAGTPVIAFGRGGVTETVVGLNEDRSPTGVFFNEASSASLAGAIAVFEENADKFHAAAIVEHAAQFHRDRFVREMRAVIERSIGKPEVRRLKPSRAVR